MTLFFFSKKQSQQPEKSNKAQPVKNTSQATKKLSFKEQYELDNLPKEIDKLEAQLEQLNNEMAQADFYQKDAHTIKQTTNNQLKLYSR